MDRIRVVHVITGLTVGGAETALYRLLRDLRDAPFDFRVVSLNGTGGLGEPIRGLGVPVVEVGLRSALTLPGALIRLRRELARGPLPHVVQAWMYHSNLATLFALPRPRPKLVWSIRTSLDDVGTMPKLTRALLPIGGRLSPRADAIVHNSNASVGAHERYGYRSERALVFHNGFDPAEFRFSETDRTEVRREFGISASALVVGCVGRFHTAKGSDLFLRMAARVLESRPDTVFLGVGRELSWSNPELAAHLESDAQRKAVHLVGERTDVPRMLSAMDVFVNPARKEGFPNVVAEAMLCERACVATATGDTALILGEAGSVVASKDLSALSSAVLRWLEESPESRAAAGRAARERIVERFPASDTAQRYADLYRRLTADESLPSPPLGAGPGLG